MYVTEILFLRSCLSSLYTSVIKFYQLKEKRLHIEGEGSVDRHFEKKT